MVVAVVLGAPLAAMAADGDAGDAGQTSVYVAQITSDDGAITQYEKLDDAVENAEEGATIELLRDCNLTQGFNKTLTFTGTGKISVDTQLTSNGESWMCFGLYDPTRVLAFDGPGVSIEWTSDGSAPWLMLSLTGTLKVTNGATFTFKFDSRTTGTRNAVYMNAGSLLEVSNGSTFQILGVGTDGNSGQGIQLDKTGTANIAVTDKSTFLIDGTNRGYVNSPSIRVEDSTFTVQNCTSNGSNGGEFVAINSNITYENNNGHGLSAGNVTIQNSTLNCNKNAYYGLTYSGDMTMDATSVINATENGYGYTGGGLRAYGKSDVESDAEINILDNKHNGMENYGTFNMESRVQFVATGNNEPSTNGGGIYNGGSLTLPEGAVVMNNYAAQTGGGICNAGIVFMPSSVQLYNNHAGDAGDDIFNRDEAAASFYPVGEEWTLDDCNHSIDGWYDDSEGARWEAHVAPYHVNEFTEFDDLMGASHVTGVRALKAAHGIAPLEPGESGDWQKSKSKTATNLDANYDSEVTLSLPSAEEQLITDVVFVLDKSTSADVEDSALKMLGELQGQIAKTGAKVKVGVVIFNKVANVANDGEFFDLSTQYDEIRSAVQKKIESGTNINAGLLAAKEMLGNDTDVSDSRKFMILVSDGQSYYYCKDGNYNTAYTISSRNGGDTGTGGKNEQPNSGLSAWECKYEKSYVPENWDAFFESVGSVLESDYGQFEYEADSPDIPPTTALDSPGSIPYADRNAYPINVDLSLYNSKVLYEEMSQKYHCFAVPADTGTVTYDFGPGFMNYLARGEEYSFEDIRNDILYLLDAGSEVVDVIGSGVDDKNAKYDFSFVDDAGRLSITVGTGDQTETLDAIRIADPQMTDHYMTSAYGFGEVKDAPGSYRYELHYYANGQDGSSDECFVWKINVPVSNFAPVSLTYSVHLDNPTADGQEHGVYSGDGSNKTATALYTNNEAILYPVDSNGEQGAPEYFPMPTVSYQTATIQPADITIYMNGEEGYEGVVDEDGTAIKDESLHLPEPGFYITLPKAVNELLVDKGLATANTPANLSEYLTISAEPKDSEEGSRSWTLVPYGESPNASSASGGYIYRIVAGGGQEPVRLEFTDGEKTYVSDAFDPTEALYNNYQMDIYSGGVDMSTVTVNLVSEEHDLDIHVPLATKPGELTIRYVTTTDQNRVVTDVIENGSDTNLNKALEEARKQNPDKALAVLNEGAKYWVNGSTVDVAPDGENYKANPSLLFDDIVTDQAGAEADEYDNRLLAKATAEITEQGHQLEIDGHESKYLDLVDAVNGNTWLTTDSTVTIYWPYPDEAGADAEYHLVHFQGLDRDMPSGEVIGQIASTEPDYIEVEKDEYGIKFTLAAEEGERVAFSPFVLVWGASSTTPPDTGDDKGDLTIKKEITGDLKSADDVFTFQVTVKGAGNQKFGDVQFTGDVAPIQLKGGESITISGLPEGADYAIVETDARGYELVSATNDDGEITDDEVTSIFTNDKSTPDEPDNPDEPDEPDNPGDPDEPSDPGTPDTPDEPSNPDEPSGPGTPSEPSRPERPSTSTSQVPDAGDHTSAVLPVALVVCGVALVGGALVIAKRRAS